MSRSRNLTHKILAEHLVNGNLAAPEIHLRVDQILVEDATGTTAALQFEALGPDHVAVPLAVIYVDHNVLQLDDRNMNDQRYLQAFAARYGLLYSRPGNGISHYVHLERFARPGALLIGADSHTPLCGAVGMIAIGAGGLEVALAMAGYGFWTEVPTVVRVELRGRLQPWVTAKDVILELLRREGVRGGRGKVFEFTGEGVDTLSVHERATICNMIVETGALTAIFPSDECVREWLSVQQREDQYLALRADPDAVYDDIETIDLAELEPLIALPHSPGNVVPVAEVDGIKTDQVCVGSSVNSAYEDLALVAAALRGRVVHPDVQLTVTPGSRQILQAIAATGVYQDLVAAGARLLEPICGPCVGVGQAPRAGVPSVRTFNRNFPGRSGTVGDQVYLCSPATAAATAIHGAITDPRRLGPPPELAPAVWDPSVVDRNILAPPRNEGARTTPLEKGSNIAPLPTAQPVPETLGGRVTIVLPDDVSTGDMAPDGALGLSIWSNIPECATYMFRRHDPGFFERALSWSGGFIVAGENYGQGSSREQAALGALQLGIRAVIAKSFARIHRRNLIGLGIVPLEFAEKTDYERLTVGDELIFPHLRGAISSGEGQLTGWVGASGPLPVRLSLLRRERELLLKGGWLNYVGAIKAG